MDESVQAELEAIKGMVLAWKESYLQELPSAGENEFLAQDLLEEIDNQVYPYVRRLYETNYLSQRELEQFLQYCYYQVEDLRGRSGTAPVDQDETIWPPGNEKESYGPH